jgi:hypothetical protein
MEAVLSLEEKTSSQMVNICDFRDHAPSLDLGTHRQPRRHYIALKFNHLYHQLSDNFAFAPRISNPRCRLHPVKSFILCGENPKAAKDNRETTSSELAVT